MRTQRQRPRLFSTVPFAPMNWQLSVGVGSCERTLCSKAGVMRRATECAQIERSIDQQDQMQDDHLSMLSLYFIFLLLLYDN